MCSWPQSGPRGLSGPAGGEKKKDSYEIGVFSLFGAVRRVKDSEKKNHFRQKIEIALLSCILSMILRLLFEHDYCWFSWGFSHPALSFIPEIKDCHAPEMWSKKVVEVPFVVWRGKMNILPHFNKNPIMTFSCGPRGLCTLSGPAGGEENFEIALISWILSMICLGSGKKKTNGWVQAVLK